jgi:5-methylcytosine-specific restriction endonuclease McrA
MSREPVQPTPRKAMTPKRRAEAFLACAGRCNACGEKITGPYEVDHRVSLFFGGSEDLSNLECLHPACHRAKTIGEAPRNAKVRRIIKSADPDTRKPSRMKSRPFGKSARKIPSRPFAKRVTA